LSLLLYLDDCAYHKLLASSLRQAGHQVVHPAQAGISGEKDPVHFAYAKTHALVLITKNPKDFLDLHNYDANHAGILAIYQDNDVTRDMNHAEITQAIANLEAAGVVLEGHFHVLNHWRY
jgi:predicted nuclease of predicted toxin-antitoxin system